MPLSHGQQLLYLSVTSLPPPTRIILISSELFNFLSLRLAKERRLRTPLYSLKGNHEGLSNKSIYNVAMGTVNYTSSQYHNISQCHNEGKATTLSAWPVPPTEQETSSLLRYFFFLCCSLSHPPTIFNQFPSD